MCLSGLLNVVPNYALLLYTRKGLLYSSEEKLKTFTVSHSQEKMNRTYFKINTGCSLRVTVVFDVTSL